MTPFEHRYILPPILLALHGILLLPAIFPPPQERHGPSPIEATGSSPEGHLYSSLSMGYSLPLGIFGFGLVMVVKQLAGKIPLPKDPSKKWLAESLEWSILFMLGSLEEVWRWGLVRLLIRWEGGGGGFGGESIASVVVGSINTGEGIKLLGNIGLGPGGVGGIWEGVYFMGWIWTLLESGFAWWGFRPFDEPEHLRSYHRHQRSIRQRNESLSPGASENTRSPRSRDGLGISPTTVSGNESSNPFFGGFRTPVWGNDQETKAVGSRVSLAIAQDPPRIDVQIASTERPAGETQFTFGHRGLLFGSRRRSSYAPLQVSPPSPTTRDFGSRHRDLEAGIHTEGDVIDSANDFGDDEEDEDSSASESDSDSDASSTRSGRSRAATPLLSSSLPYDPQSEHPHHEQQSLLQHNFRRMSYNTLNLNFNEPVPVPWDSNVDGDTESDVQVLIRDNSRDGVVTIQPDGLSPQRPRAYPSYPSYSASYNHSHFSTPPGPSNFQQQQQQQSQQQPQRSIIHRISSISSASSPRPQLLPIVPPSQAQQHIQNRRPSKMPTRHYVRMIYGVSVNSLPLYLPIMWRLGATLRGLANALLFAWFPELIYKGKFQFFTLLVVGFIATKKGWYTVDWVGGGVVRSGILKISSMTLVIQTATYLIALGLWSIIFY